MDFNWGMVVAAPSCVVPLFCASHCFSKHRKAAPAPRPDQEEETPKHLPRPEPSLWALWPPGGNPNITMGEEHLAMAPEKLASRHEVWMTRRKTKLKWQRCRRQARDAKSQWNL